jgi:hypothetical protein
MPGFSSECSTGQHKACTDPVGHCRCLCHEYTQELLRKEVIDKPRGGKVPRGRRGRSQQPIAVAERALSAPREKDDLRNTCPSCQKQHPDSKHFCTECGSKLCLGTFCQRCEEPCDALDKFCGLCGWRLADPMTASAPALTETVTARVNPMPNMKLRLSLPPVEGDPTNGKPSPLPPGIAALEVAIPEQEDPLLRLRRQAIEQGLLNADGSPKQTIVT